MQHSHVVLIIADHANFSRDLTARWQLERHLPCLTVIRSERINAVSDHVGLAIVGPVGQGRLAAALKAVDTGVHPVICMAQTAGQLQNLKAEYPRLLCFAIMRPGWTR